MKIAILMSTYNGEKYIKEQIDSILAQEGDFQIDLWVRDDGSQDNTQKILQEYANAGKLKWYTGVNMGPAKSFLDLLKHCEGYDFYAFSDQDDYWMTDKICAGLDMIVNEKVPALYCSNAELVNQSLQSYGRLVYKETPRTDFYTSSCAGGILGCTMLFNLQLARLVQKKEMPEKIVMHDFYMVVLCGAVKGKIIYDEQAHMKYRQHGNNVVGVSYGLMNTLKQRHKDIATRPKVSIAEQAQSVLKLVYEEIPDENRKWLIKIVNYPKCATSKIALAVSLKTKYINKNMAMKLRLSILFGNR